MPSTKYLKGECQHCRGHLEFPAEHTGLVVDCPHCGQPTELMLALPRAEPVGGGRALMWAVVALVILGLGLGASLVALRMAQQRAERLRPRPTPAALPAEAPPVPTDPLAQQGLSVSEIRLEKKPGTSLVYATGTLKNVSTRQRFGLKLEFDLLGANGEKVGTASDYQRVLDPAAEWHFHALVVEAKAVEARLTSVKEEQ